MVYESRGKLIGGSLSREKSVRSRPSGTRVVTVSANYNMKINTKRTKVLRVSIGSKSDNEDSSYRGNYRTSQGILLLRKHDLRRCHREIKRRIATAASIWFEIWGVVDPGKKIDFYREISEIFRFFQAIKKFDFPSKKLSIYSYVWANYSISLQK